MIAAGQGVTVFAAASLRDALEDISAAYKGEVILSYGGSGQIARQVAQGAPANIVVLANKAWMDWLENAAPQPIGNRLNLLGNRLVLIGEYGADPLPAITAKALLSRLRGGRLAIGHTNGVPAGMYARQWMENAHLWSDLSDHLAETENVRAALALVARGEASLGIVYASDAQAEGRVAILYDIPSDAHEPVVYPMAAVGERSIQVVEFITFIQSQTASDIFRAHGFQPLSEAR